MMLAYVMLCEIKLNNGLYDRFGLHTLISSTGSKSRNSIYRKALIKYQIFVHLINSFLVNLFRYIPDKEEISTGVAVFCLIFPTVLWIHARFDYCLYFILSLLVFLNFFIVKHLNAV